jgi:fucose permease
MSKRHPILLLVVAYIGFISLGLPDTLFGVAWPFVREEFGLPLRMAGSAFLAGGIAYGLSAALSGRALGRLGVGSVLFWSSALVCLAVFGFAMAPGWIIFVTCTFAHGLGSGAIDTGLNHYAARHFSARQMNWLHASFGFGAALGPATMTTALVSTGSWRDGYMWVGALLAALSLLFLTTRGQWREPVTLECEKHAKGPGLLETLQSPAVRFHLVAFFIYAGAESAVGQWSFTLLSGSRGLGAAAAGSIVTIYWAAILAGRILSGFIVERIGSARLVRWSSGVAACGAALVLIPLPPALTIAGILLVGLAFAPMFPCLMSLTPERVGERRSANAAGLQVTAATLGIAIIPALAGFAADRVGLESLPILWLALTLAMIGLHLPRRWQDAPSPR